MDETLRQASEEARQAWDENAAFWDQRMGEGNDFFRVLIWPPTERLLDLRPGDRVLDIACGNGLTSRQMAERGAEVVAFDFSEAMVSLARARPSGGAQPVDYRVLDGTDEAALLALGERSFDAALCNMALFDMADIAPVMRSLRRLLKPGGCFVFSVTHPCFNHANALRLAELDESEGRLVTTYSVRVRSYMTPTISRGVGIVGQPVPHLYFDRPLHALLTPAFQSGFVLDALEERAFPPDHPPGRQPLSWGGQFSEIPPVLVGRFRLPRQVR